MIYLLLCVIQQHVCWQAGVHVNTRERETEIFQETDSCRCYLGIMYWFQDSYFLKKIHNFLFSPLCLKTVLICAFSQFSFLLVWWNCVGWIPGLCHGALLNCSIRVFIVWLQIVCTARSSYWNISFAKYFIICRNWLL